MQRIHPDDRERVNVELDEALRQKRDFSLAFRIVLSEGTIKYIESTGRPLFSADGELVEMVATHVDVTERKRAQEEHEKLRQLESDLAHVNRVSILGEMAATLAHEILHPIAAARNNARAAARFLDLSPPDLNEVRDALDCIVRDADRAKDIVGGIRAHMKKAPPRYDRFDLNETISEVIVMVRSAIEKNGVAVSTRFTPGLLLVRGDRVQLQQVIVNLILNAIEAMSAVEKGARKLSISTERSQSGGVLVAIRDSGHGHRCGKNRASLPALLHHQGKRYGNGAVDLPVHYRRPWGPTMGRGQSTRRRAVPIHVAAGHRLMNSPPAAHRA